MNSKVKDSVRFALNVPRALPVYAAIAVSKSTKMLVDGDSTNWWAKTKECEPPGPFRRFVSIAGSTKEFRNVAELRMRQTGCLVGRLMLRILLPPLSTLYINTVDVGPRLFIQHGFSTIVSAKSLGADCWINQQVTIGHGYKGNPVIGNGVRIAAGAKVIGAISLGDNSVVGANAVVTKDVPEREVWGGVPAKRISFNADHCLHCKES